VIEKVVACGAILSIKHFAGMQPPSNSFFSILTRAHPWGAPDFFTCGLGGAGFFVKRRGRLLLPDVLVFGRDILAGIFSH